MERKYIMGRYEVVQTLDNEFWVRSLKWGWKTGVGLVKPADNNNYDVIETFLDYKTAERFTDKLACGILVVEGEQENDIKLITSLLDDPDDCSEQEFSCSCKTLGLTKKEWEDISKLPREQAVNSFAIVNAIVRLSV